VRVQIQTVEGVYLLDLEDDSLIGPGDAELDTREAPPLSLPRLVAASAAGSTVVAVVDARPPMLVSHDGGRTWRDSGRGLPPGHAVDVSPENPDHILFAARNRLYVSMDGGRFWRSLEAELPDIEAVAWE
jgi:hypothetical protein